jgi:hypothetical protein
MAICDINNKLIVQENKMTQIKAILLLLIILGINAASTCGGNCPSGNCNKCPCGNTKTIYDVQ